MFGDKIKKIEEKIKKLNALKADYRKELDEHHRELERKEISQEKYDKIKAKTEARMEEISKKISEKRAELEELKKAKK